MRDVNIDIDKPLTPAMMRRLADHVRDTRRDARYGIDRFGLTDASELSLIMSPLVRVEPRLTKEEDAQRVKERDDQIAEAKHRLDRGDWENALVCLRRAQDADRCRHSIRLVASDEGLAAVANMGRIVR